MKTRKLVPGLVLSILLALSAFPQMVAAQNLWEMPSFDRGIGVEIAKPIFDGDGISFATSSTFLSVVWPLSDGVRFVGELPISYAAWDDEYENDSDIAMGNPYLGVSLGKEDSNLLGQVGIRLPLVSESGELGEAEWVGMFTNRVDRLGAFMPDVVPVGGSATYQYRTEDGFVALFTGGADIWVATDDDSDRVEAMGLYGARFGYDGPEWTVLGGLLGRGILTEEHVNLSSGTLHEAGLELAYRGASVQPRFFVRLPLDEDLRDLYDAKVGVGLRIAF